MLSAKNSIDSCDLNQLQEKNYQLTQVLYHLKEVDMAIKEALYHLQKYSYHASLIEDANNILNLEVHNG